MQKNIFRSVLFSTLAKTEGASLSLVIETELKYTIFAAIIFTTAQNMCMVLKTFLF